MLLPLGVGLGAALVFLGLFTYALAPYAAPNRFIGVRIHYAWRTPAAWDITNRTAGIALALIGSAYAALSYIWSLAGLPLTWGVLLFPLLLVSLLALSISLWRYSRRIASSPNPPSSTRMPILDWYHLPHALAFALLVATAAYFYPRLPQGDIPAHFNLSGQPDHRSATTFALAGPALTGLSLLLTHLALIFYITRRPGLHPTLQTLTPHTLLAFAVAILTLIQLLLAYLLLDTSWYTLHTSHILPPFAILVVSLIAGLTLLINTFITLVAIFKATP